MDSHHSPDMVATGCTNYDLTVRESGDGILPSPIIMNQSILPCSLDIEDIEDTEPFSLVPISKVSELKNSVDSIPKGTVQGNVDQEIQEKETVQSPEEQSVASIQPPFILHDSNDSKDKTKGTVHRTH